MGAIRLVFWVVGAVLLVSVVLVTVHLSANNLEFSRYNIGWNGTSTFFAELDRHRTAEIREPEQLGRYASGALLLIIAPDHPPSKKEITAYRSFLERGNTIVLLDDFGSGSSFLEDIGSRITILPGNLSSVDRQYADPYTIVVYQCGNSSLVNDVPSLLLDRPSAVEGGRSLMLTSLFSWIDSNGDRKINSGELLGQFTVMAEEEVGSGTLLVLSDPSVLINSMYDTDGTLGNRQFISNIIGYTGPVLIDQMNSRTGDAEGLSGMLHVIRTTFIITILCVVVLMLAAAMAWKRKFL